MNDLAIIYKITSPTGMSRSSDVFRRVIASYAVGKDLEVRGYAMTRTLVFTSDLGGVKEKHEAMTVTLTKNGIVVSKSIYSDTDTKVIENELNSMMSHKQFEGSSYNVRSSIMTSLAEFKADFVSECLIVVQGLKDSQIKIIMSRLKGVDGATFTYIVGKVIS